MNETDWDTLLDQLEALNFRASIVGPHGSGKSTLLRELSSQLVEHGLNVHELTLRDECPSVNRIFYHKTLPTLTLKHLLLLDGSEFLSDWGWERLTFTTRKLAGLIVTCHDNPRFPVLHRCIPSCNLFIELSKRLLGFENDIPVSELEAIYTASDGNIRDAFWCLYDRFA